jgi:endonuclease/exonuclease/phosphatase family metal-dependent hydrolase
VPTLRLLSYNVRSLRDDPIAVARVIRTAAPDVVCIQEAPRFLRWRSKCAELARRSGLVVVGGGRDTGANLIMSTLAVDVESVHSVLFTRDPKLHQRGTAIALLRLAGRPFAVAGTHLDLVEEPRVRHVAELHAAVDAHVPAATPIVVAGDMNDDPGSATWAALSARGDDAWIKAGEGPGYTSTATSPRRRIDAIFVDPRLSLRSAEVCGASDVLIASDHRPLLVEFEL